MELEIKDIISQNNRNFEEILDDQKIQMVKMKMTPIQKLILEKYYLVKKLKLQNKNLKSIS